MKDRDDLKQALLKQVPDLIVYLESLADSYQRLKEYIVPLLVSFLYMQQPNVPSHWNVDQTVSRAVPRCCRAQTQRQGSRGVCPEALYRDGP